jgi:hypothetical protein
MQCFFSLPSEEKRSLSVGEILGAISLLLTVLDGVLVEVVDSSDFGTMVADCSRERQNTEVIQSTGEALLSMSADCRRPRANF